jgi:hypothetical protein
VVRDPATTDGEIRVGDLVTVSRTATAISSSPFLLARPRTLAVLGRRL